MTADARIIFLAGCLLMGVTAYAAAWGLLHDPLANMLNRLFGVGYSDACFYSTSLLLFLTGAGIALGAWRWL